ncbi:cysteine dioxygenase family protein [Coralloluteibacterium stylophorae]|uniref:Cysteine dioxygenase family protein n=1 Tax=Coralloluteibacterium stylophorae TaxID=1776034 RepID=A0A8J7VVR2_9GAMM|nr:cysteine dioxygenase family protein [Coralloluteibacterium stylophorae]MBS7457562.1 cysteine dioxygenase family protein [Coralloluteibacterium stylophorae]
MNAAPTFASFPGRERLVARLDEAVALGDDQAVTAALRGALCGLIRDRDVHLPEAVFAPIDDHYARREIYRSADYGYSVVAMTWGPGQGTPLHDHCGLWCVEGVWHGQLEITQYELLDRDGDHARFRMHGGMLAGIGSAGSLIPPHEYHTIRNPSDRDVAVSLHVYQSEMKQCAVFREQAGGGFVRQAVALARDAC